MPVSLRHKRQFARALRLGASPRARTTMCAGRARGGSCRHGCVEAARWLHREPHGVCLAGVRSARRAVSSDRCHAAAGHPALRVHDVPELALQHLWQPRAHGAPPGPHARLARAGLGRHALRGVRAGDGALWNEPQPRLRDRPGVLRARGRGLMWTNMLGGDPALSLAAILVSTVAAPFTIPLTLHALLGQTIEVDAARMMGEMIVSIALPALVGTVANDLTRGRAARELSPVIAPAAKIALVLVILTNSTGVAPYVRNLTPTLVAVAAFICAFSAGGYALGLLAARIMRRPYDQTASMTYLVGMRNISAGAVIAGEYFPGEVMFPVVIGTLFQQVLAACFGSLLRRTRRRRARG